MTVKKMGPARRRAEGTTLNEPAQNYDVRVATISRLSL